MTIRKLIISVVLASMIVAIASPVSASAFKPPPLAFGGGHNAIHAYAAHGHQSTYRHKYSTFLGILTIEHLNRIINVYAGATIQSMDFGAGHFSFTGLNQGNTALIGHNRHARCGAQNGFFSFARLLLYGDIITLDAGGITRTYEVFMSAIICETDFTPLKQFGDNRLTLITCVEYTQNKRRAVVAREVIQ